MEKIGPVLLFLAGLGVALLAGKYLRAAWYSGPRRFTYLDEPFIWVPDEEKPSFFRAEYEDGDFQYGDGTPVTDHRLYRELQDYWVRQNQPSNNQ